jgi:hypothetical protein
MMYGMEVWSSDGGWKEIYRIHRIICNKVLGLPTFAANSMAELKLEGGSRRGKVLCRSVKYWLHLLHRDSEEIELDMNSR